MNCLLILFIFESNPEGGGRYLVGDRGTTIGTEHDYIWSGGTNLESCVGGDGIFGCGKKFHVGTGAKLPRKSCLISLKMGKRSKSLL